MPGTPTLVELVVAADTGRARSALEDLRHIVCALTILEPPADGKDD